MASAAIIVAPVVTTGLPEAPVNGAVRVHTDGNGSFLQVKAPTGEWVNVFAKIEGGHPVIALSVAG